MHPRMNVALHRNELRLIVFRVDGGRAWWLRLVPLWVDFRKRVDVVRGLIVIVNLQLLGNLHRKNVRQILAALLVISHSLRRRGRALIATGDIYDYPLEGATRSRSHILSEYRSSVLFRTGRLFRHINRFHLRRRARVGYLSRY